jgi:hypothetical protein
MSAPDARYRTSIVQIVVFAGIVAVFAYAFQKVAIEWIFRSAMVGLFAPQIDKTATGPVISRNPQEFILDMSDVKRTMERDQYDKPAGDWIVRAESLGEHPVKISPWLTFGIFSVFFGFLMGVIITTMLPRSIGYVSNKIERTIVDVNRKIMDQTGWSRSEVARVTTTPESILVAAGFPEQSRAALDRNSVVDPDADIEPVVRNEIDDVIGGNRWRRAKFRFMSGLRLYMVRHFSEKYSNNVQGFAYGGAAILIVVIGIRGLKFIPATEPSVLLFAISLEFTMLLLLAVTLFYTEEEERMDKLTNDLRKSATRTSTSADAQSKQLDRILGAIQDQVAESRALRSMLFETNQTVMREVVQRAIAEYLTDENTRGIAQEVIRQKIDDALADIYGTPVVNGGATELK